ncbi:Sec-independent protein translocase protein TatB [Neisseria leonii]|uniref:Sec-independent protein translocase protein TatB n=1 Tax=Neisseria leonii TaxID=2995413 RepID=UPI00237A6012|nr:Sec-independent protein translocase protein TatB [Neisseria sp. 3986]MDD9324982.1 Sec-independent protein translocase protein TatB [Neisseria sp. 3986]
MFDFGFGELLLVGAVALVVLGPERLPVVARTAGRWLGKLQQLSAGFKNELSRQAAVAELHAVKADWDSAVDGVRQGLAVPAWERLPEQRSPADFGVDESGRPLPLEDVYTPGADGQLQTPAWHSVSLRRRALVRRREVRTRVRAKAAVRVHRARRID